MPVMDLHGVEAAVLVQPSFLGTNNGYINRCLMAHRDRLRGVAVVDGRFSFRDLELLHSIKMRGIRFNLLGGGALPDLSRGGWPGMLRFMRDEGWHIQLAAPGPSLPPLLDRLLETRVQLVVDHFGHPDPALGVACAGFRKLLAMGSEVVVKVSAPYRLGGLAPQELIQALAAAQVRMVWGSDYPHTQMPPQPYARLAELAALLPGAEATARQLYAL
jgi:predicted TIM-barrel fold metal-dependent hydrolase